MSVLTLELLAALRTDAGAALLREAERLGDDDFAASRLRPRAGSVELAAAAVDQVRLRRRARAKFRVAERLWFTQSLLEQASGDALAEWRARRYPDGAAVNDLCCGLGGDAMALARRGPVVAVDRDPLALALTEANCEARGLSDVRRFLSDATALSDGSETTQRRSFLWIDPGRRETGRRTRRLEEMSPPLSQMLPLLEEALGAGIKLSPATDHQELDAGLAPLGNLAQEREFLSVAGECRELALWVGSLAGNCSRRATLLPEGLSLDGEPQPIKEIAPVGEYLLEPDPAVLRAGLVGNLAQGCDLWGIDPQLSYLSGDSLPETPFGRSYRVEAPQAFSQKALTRSLRERGIGTATLKTRGTVIQPEALQQALRGVLKQGDRTRHAVVFLTRLAGRPVFLLGEALASGRA